MESVSEFEIPKLSNGFGLSGRVGGCGLSFLQRERGFGGFLLSIVLKISHPFSVVSHLFILTLSRPLPLESFISLVPKLTPKHAPKKTEKVAKLTILSKNFMPKQISHS